jgi:hypothetical protein
LGFFGMLSYAEEFHRKINVCKYMYTLWRALFGE